MFSSYVQWWFSSPRMVSGIITTWAICLGCAVSFFKDQHRGKLTLALASFIFCGTNFVLCLYPPYQIPLTLLMLAILIGVWLENCDKQDSKSTIRGLILIGTGLLAIAVILIPYWINVRGTLEMVAHTVYPGQRRSAGGELSLFKLFSGVLGFFESEQTVPPFTTTYAKRAIFIRSGPQSFLRLYSLAFEIRRASLRYWQHYRSFSFASV